jgi:tRNA nucleotidyltransferase (CCA-adding enzyme)
LCRPLDLASSAPERQLQEWRKLLGRGTKPSLGLEFLREANLIRFYPELQALIGVPQDPEWHPEGDVWTHTAMVCDAAVQIDAERIEREGSQDAEPDWALLFGALCHDLGKPATTTAESGGRVRSLGHDVAGMQPTRELLSRLRAPNALIEQVVGLVRHHLAPALLRKGEAGPRAYRRLSRWLAEAGTDMETLEKVARADHFGRTTEDARAGLFDAGDAFLRCAAELSVERKPPVDIVQGRDLVARGMTPGPEFSEILNLCRAVSDDRGWTDPARILDEALERWRTQGA